MPQPLLLTPDPDSTPEQSAPLADVAPSLDEWRALYAVAVRFRDLAPWTWLEEEQLFGVRDPESGEVGYCCIMGQMGEHFALAVYRGTAGLNSLWDLRTGPPPELMDSWSLLDAQDCLMASFEDREEIEEEDREVIKSLGLKFRGRGAWPQFRSYLPGAMPWFLNRAEARFLTAALEQALVVVQRLKEEPDLLPPPALEGPYLVRVLEMAEGGTREEWRDALLKTAPLVQAESTAVPVDKERLAPLLALTRTNGILEMDMVRLPEAVQEEEGARPVFPYMLLAVAVVTQQPTEQKAAPRKSSRTPRRHAAKPAKREGLIAGAEIAIPREAPERFAEMLPEVVLKAQALPHTVIVSRRSAYIYLEETARVLGIELIQGETTAVEGALESLMGMMSGFGVFEI